ncbi:MAG: hypothetical protein HC900_05150 [Methylacidiphilales bacterium]|nr:hypothetical protein [Candidatus Methylacidiphilales bacterium]
MRQLKNLEHPAVSARSADAPALGASRGCTSFQNAVWPRIAEARFAFAPKGFPGAFVETFGTLSSMSLWFANQAILYLNKIALLPMRQRKKGRQETPSPPGTKLHWRDHVMTLRKALPVAGALFLAGSLPGHAGPCSAAIDRMQARVDAVLAARAAAGPTATESAGATTHRQPTPESIAAAEARLGDISTETMDAVAVGMAEAREADRAGNAKTCEEALAKVGRALGPRAD